MMTGMSLAAVPVVVFGNSKYVLNFVKLSENFYNSLMYSVLKIAQP